MDIRQLRYFTTVADTGSLTKAAEVLPLAQSALSRHIGLLEEELGVTLFTRTGRGVELTEHGEFLRGRAVSLLEQVEDIKRSLASSDGEPGGLIRIGMPPSIVLCCAAALFEEAKARYPKVTIRLTEGLSATLVEWIGSDRLDMAVVLDYPAKTHHSVELLREEELCLAVKPGVRPVEPISLPEMAAMPLIAPFARKGIRNRMAEAFRQAGLEFRPAYELDALPAMKELVKRGTGAAILSRAAVREEEESGELDVLPIDAPNMRYNIFLLSRRGAAHSRAAHAISALLHGLLGNESAEASQETSARRS